MTARRGRKLFTRFALALVLLALTLPEWFDPAGMAAAVTAPLRASFTGDGWGFSAGEGEHAPAVIAQEGDTENCFTQPAGSPFAAGGAPQSVAAGDFNLDGKPDLVAANRNTDDVTILAGDGAGGFAAASNVGVGEGSGPQSVAVGDFNLDGKPDLATANSVSNTVSVLLNACTGVPCGSINFTAAPGSPVGVGSLPFMVAVGDFNLDNKPDLATANANSASVTILTGDGAGGFTPTGNIGVGSGPISVVVDDLNRDGKPDLATTNAASNNVTILLNNCTKSPCESVGFAAAPGSPVGVGTGPAAAAVGDFNLDGKPDLAVANANSASVTTLTGDGAGGFAAVGNIGVGAAPRSVAVGDFNRDGKSDLATANTGSGNVTILAGDGAGGFAAAVNFGAINGPISVAIGDFNLDDQPDLATANASTNNLSVFLSNCAGAPCGSIAFTGAPGSPVGVGDLGPVPQAMAESDFNLDGKRDLATANYNDNNVTILLGSGTGGFTSAGNVGVGSNPTSVAVGDFNRDGKPDFAAANSSDISVSVLLGNGEGGFAREDIDVDGQPVSVAVGDFNRDGKPDLAAVNNNPPSPSVTILAGNGAGGFTSAGNIGIGGGAFTPFPLVVGDFNRDGKPDFAAANTSGSTFSVLLNNCTGVPCGSIGFTAAPGSPVGVGGSPYSMATGDFNLDGKPDIVTVNAVNDTDNSATILLGNGTGGFISAGSVGVPFGSIAVAVSDFNLDGKPDLATSGSFSGSVTILAGNGAGGFTSAGNIGIGGGAGEPWSVVVGDFNRDGKPDFATGNYDPGNVSVLLNNCGSTQTAAANLTASPSTRVILNSANNLAGHVLIASDFSGAGLQNVDLSNAVLAGANLTKANLTGAKLTGASLIDANLPSVNLSNAVLTSARLNGANLTGATLDGVSGLAGADLSLVVLSGASLRQIDLSTAKLYGATLDGANLEGANMSGTFLTNNPPVGITAAASLAGARLKNVNLSKAQLSGANFTNANFYGSDALGEKTCDIDDNGFTQGCASAAGATLNNTQFAGAYLYGVDFTNTTIQGVQFGNAVLVGTNFAGANLSTDPDVGTESGFNAAFLQGANLATANLSSISLRNAFVDFRSTGNDMYLRLDGTHTVFAGWQTPGQQVCVFTFYTGPTTVPTTNTTLTCPDGSQAGAAGCGPTEAANTRWRSLVEIDQTNPPASYLEDATYTKKAETPICSPFNSDW